MSCALCQQDRPLRESHILLEFLHRPIYDDKHRTLILDLKSDPEGRPRDSAVRRV